VGHRLGAHDAEALAVRRAGHDGSAPVQRDELIVGKHSERAWHAVPERAVPGDDQRQPSRRLQQLEDALLGREPAGEEDLGRIRRRRNLAGDLDAARDHLDVLGSELPRLTGERGRGADRQARATEDRAGERRRPAGELDVGAPELDDVRLSRRTCDRARRQPVRMDQVRPTRRAPGGPCERAEEGGQRERLQRAGAEIPDHARSVRDPEVAKRGGGDDLDVGSSPPEVLDRVGHEAAGRIPREPRVRRRQDDDPHGLTIGSSSS